MKPTIRYVVCCVHFLTLAIGRTDAATSFTFPRSTPEAQGVSSAAVLSLIEALDRIDALHSFMLVRHGQVVAEGWWTPYDPASNHELYSLSKSFTSTAVGLAIAEGTLSVDDEVLKFFPEDAPAEPSANLKAMRVRDLLTMSAGHQDETASGADTISAKAFLGHPVPHKPGTHFKYNTPATFMLSAILQKQTGQTVLEYLRPRLLDPLGITQPVWSTNWQGIDLGGYGLSVRTEDIARFGQLYLQKGKWQGKSLIQPQWVELATSKQVSNGSNPASDWDQGYGFQFWRSRHGAYRGDGAFGQYCVVMPEQDTVIAITAGLKDMQAVLNVLWDTLLPALGPKRLKADVENQKKLTEKLRGLTVRPAEGSDASPLASEVLGRKYLFPANERKLESITLIPNSNGPGLMVSIQAGGVSSEFVAGYRTWKQGTASFGNYLNRPSAATAACAQNDTLVVKQCFTETPFHLTHTLRFEGRQLSLDTAANVGFRATQQPQLVGRAE